MALFGSKKEEQSTDLGKEKKPKNNSGAKKSVTKKEVKYAAPARKDFTVLKSPLITEKAARLGEQGTYTFKVDTAANKIEIRSAVEKMYKVEVETVRTVRVPGHTIRRGRITGWHPGYKKAMVTLQEGHKIEIV